MAIGIDPDSPHVQVLWYALVERNSEWTLVTTMGALAIICSLHQKGELSGLTSDKIGNACWWFSSHEFFVLMLIGAGWLVYDGDLITLGPAWDNATIKE